jgi:hypothetical protein
MHSRSTQFAITSKIINTKYMTTTELPQPKLSTDRVRQIKRVQLPTFEDASNTGWYREGLDFVGFVDYSPYFVNPKLPLEEKMILCREIFLEQFEKFVKMTDEFIGDRICLRIQFTTPDIIDPLHDIFVQRVMKENGSETVFSNSDIYFTLNTSSTEELRSKLARIFDVEGL